MRRVRLAQGGRGGRGETGTHESVPPSRHGLPHALALLGHEKVEEPAPSEGPHVALDDALVGRAVRLAADDLDRRVGRRVRRADIGRLTLLVRRLDHLVLLGEVDPAAVGREGGWRGRGGQLEEDGQGEGGRGSSDAQLQAHRVLLAGSVYRHLAVHDAATGDLWKVRQFVSAISKQQCEGAVLGRCARATHHELKVAGADAALVALEVLVVELACEGSGQSQLRGRCSGSWTSSGAHL